MSIQVLCSLVWPGWEGRPHPGIKRLTRQWAPSSPPASLSLSPSAFSNYSRAAECTRSPYCYRMLSLSHGARHGIQVPRSVGSWVDSMQVRVKECVTAYFTAASSALHLGPAHAAPRSLSSRPHTHPPRFTPLTPTRCCLLFRPSLWPRGEGPLKAKSLGSTTRCRLGECCCCTTLGPLGPLSALLELWTWPHPRSDQISQIRSTD